MKIKKKRTTSNDKRGGQRSRSNRISNPTFLLIGQGSVLDEVRSVLAKLRAKVHVMPWSRDVLNRIDEKTTAVVLVSPLPGISMSRAVRAVREHEHGKGTALFTVLTGDAAREQARSIYEEGVSAIFEWPDEAGVLPLCMVEMIAANFVRGRASEPDAALARAVRYYLKERCSFNCRVKVTVADGLAMLNGSVDHLWQKERVREIASEVPGLRGVVARDVFVSPSGITDKEVRADIKRMLKTVTDIDTNTISVRVQNGHVILAGSVSNRGELNRLVNLLTNIRGVRSIEKLTVVSPLEKQRDSRIAGYLRKRVSRSFGNEDVEVAFFGKTAVLSGRVSSLLVKQRIEEHLKQDNAVERIVSKLDVVS